MRIERIGLRFNLDKESDKKAFEFLQGVDCKSLNKYIISIIAEYADNSKTEKKIADYIDVAVDAINNAINTNATLQFISLIGQATQNIQQPTAPQEAPKKNIQDENASASMNFLNSIYGK